MLKTCAELGFLQVPDFGSFYDRSGWAGRTISGQYVATIIELDYLERSMSLNAELQGIGGKIYKMDHTVKVATKVVMDDERIARFSHAIMNEYNQARAAFRCCALQAVDNHVAQIMSWVLTHSDGDEELRDQFASLRQRYELNAWERGKYRYVDVACCRQDGHPSVWQQAFNMEGVSKLDAMHFFGRRVQLLL